MPAVQCSGCLLCNRIGEWQAYHRPQNGKASLFLGRKRQLTTFNCKFHSLCCKWDIVVFKPGEMRNEIFKVSLKTAQFMQRKPALKQINGETFFLFLLMSGFTGKNCSQNIDDCPNHECQNGGTCVDGVNTYNCQCKPEFTGLYVVASLYESVKKPVWGHTPTYPGASTSQASSVERTSMSAS